MLSLYLFRDINGRLNLILAEINSKPFVVDGPYDEPQGGAHGIHILIHQFLHYGRLPGIVQPSAVM